MTYPFIQRAIFWTITCAFLASIGFADVPTLINYRGYIADKPGTQSLQIEFSLYEQDQGGTAIWSEIQPVDLFDGNFAVLLGSVTPLNVGQFMAANRFLGVKVTGEQELQPRQQIVSVPYAFQAELALQAETAATATNADTLDGVDSTGFVKSNTPAWLQSLGVSSTPVTSNPSAMLHVNVQSTDSNTSGILVNGSPNGGDMGLKLYNTGTGGRRWFIDSTNNASTEFGGGKLVFMHIERPFIRPFSEEGEKQEGQQAGIKPSQIIIDPPIFLDDLWVDILVLNAANNRVGILTSDPQQTLDVRGTIGNAGTVYHSDKRWKTNITDLDHSLEKVTQLHGVHYEWRTDTHPEMNFSSGPQIGLIAQEVETVLPEVVSTSDAGYKSVDYARIVPLLIESIKEQQQQIETLRAELDAIKNQ